MGDSSSIQLIVGLGNPGSQYAKTRHNAGFWFVETLANSANEAFRLEAKFSGEVCKVNIAGKRVWLLKPTTFMNRSGLSVKQLCSFYKIPINSILVVHDELDLPPGTVRLKMGGGHGGHNGLRDIHAQMGKEYLRARVGVGHPGDRSKVVDYVLSRPNEADCIDIMRGIDHLEAVTSEVISGNLQQAMNRLHTET